MTDLDGPQAACNNSQQFMQLALATESLFSEGAVEISKDVNMTLQ